MPTNDMVNEGVTPTPRTGTGFDPLLKRLALVVVLGTIMSILDTTIVNVAIATLARDFRAPLSTVQWVSTGYLLALATPPDPYTATLVRSVETRAAEIDSLITGAAIGWDLHRMAVVDRNVLRLAVAELMECPDVPTAVILNEAVELASAYSTDDSGRFVNGVLATLALQVRG